MFRPRVSVRQPCGALAAGRRRAALATVVVALLAVGLAACGSSTSGTASESSATIFADALRAAKSAHSVRLKGSVEDFGHLLSVNLLVEPGRALSGTIEQDGHTFDVVVVDGRTYVRGQTAVELFGSVSVARRLGAGGSDVWLQLDRAHEFAKFTRLTDLSEVVSGLSGLSLRKETGKSAAGRGAVALATNEHGTLYVASSGSPLPLEVVRDRKENGAHETLSFEDWNAAAEISAPAGAQTLSELAKLV